MMVALASTLLLPKQRNEAVRSPTRAASWLNPRAQFDAVSRTINGGAINAQERWGAYQRALRAFSVSR